jgi:hypothetical protein
VRSVIYTFAANTQPYGVAIIPNPTASVGGSLMLVNPYDVLAPYMALGIAVCAVFAVYFMRRSARA